MSNDNRVESLIMQLRHGGDLTLQVKPWPRIQATDACRSSGALQGCLDDGADRVSTWPGFVRELYGRLYTGDNCKPLEYPKGEAVYAQKLHQMLDELPEWQRLIERCRGDAYASTMASVGMGGTLYEHVPEHKYDAAGTRRRMELLEQDYEALRREMEAMGQPLPREPTALSDTKKAHLKAQHEAAQTGAAIEEAASLVRNSARQAMQRANDWLDGVDDALNACGWGTQDAGVGESSMANVKAEIARRLAQRAEMKKIFDLAGRLKDVMRQEQSAKVRQGAGELTDVEAGANVARLLPSELMLMGHPTARYLLARKLHEKSALQYRLQDRKPKSKGPVVVCVDESASMRGSRDVWAKAVALALLELARKQKRDYCLCTFNTKLNATFAESAKTKSLPSKLIDALLQFRGGGTSFDPPLEWALEQIEKATNMRDADVIFISDGACRAAQVQEYKAKAQKLGVRIIGIAVGASAIHAEEEGSMKDFCKEVHPVTELKLDEDDAERDAAARAVLGI